MYIDDVDKGGTNAAPNPYDLLLASLGACTSMTLKMYAGRKEWPLDHVSVDVSHDRIHAEDCVACETRKGKIDRFRRIIRLEEGSGTKMAPEPSFRFDP